MIFLEQIAVTFHQGTNLEKKALQNLSLRVGEGDFITIIGGNGAGKSTLFSVLTGDITPSKGRIFIGGEDVTKDSPEKRSAYVARVFQDPLKGTCAALTIEENLALALCRGQRRNLSLALNRANRSLFRDHIARLNLGLENRMGLPIGVLSGGQRQAISLIMAVLSPMQLLLLDEHTAALDPRTAAFIIKLTKEIVEASSLTTLMITHSMHQALDVGSRLLMLQDGTIVHDASDQDKKKLTQHDLMLLFEKYNAV